MPEGQRSPHSRPNETVTGILPADRIVEVSVLLRENPDGPSVEQTLGELSSQPVAQRRYLTAHQYEALHGATTADVARVRRFAVQHGLHVTNVDRTMRTVKLSGTPSQLKEAFSVQLLEAQRTDGGRHHTIGDQTPSIHRAIADAVVGVVGFESRPFARPRLAGVQVSPNAAKNAVDPPQVGKRYNWPQVDGTGTTIGIIELGGQVSDADVTAYFTRLGLPKPTIKHVSVDGAQPTSDPNGADVEVALDVEVIGGLAPGCTIVIYDAPNTEQGFIDAVAAAANDTINKPSVVSISWGAPESGWTAAGMQGMDAAAAAGNAMGLTYTAAAGDNGAPDGVTDGNFHADHPSSSPHYVACGGTFLNPDGTETVWGGTSGNGATGGEVSSTFPRPSWQQSVTTQSKKPAGQDGRWVADVSGNADPQSGWNVTSGGQDMSVGGTSAVAPMWAALLAITAKILGKPLGDPHSLLYSAGVGAYNDITVGNNNVDGNTADGYDAAPGYDPPTGLGSPNASNLIKALGGTPSLCPPYALPGRAQQQRSGRSL